jgi:hypothetical protein
VARKRSKPNIKGLQRTRGLLKRLPDAVRAEINQVFEDKAPAALAFARASTPRKTGALANALRVKTFARSLSLKLGLLTKGDRRDFFYGNILDRGRRPQTVTVRRGNRQVSGGRVVSALQTYTMKVKAIPAARYDIVFGRVGAYVKNLIGVPAREIFTKALQRAGGVGDGD